MADQVQARLDEMVPALRDLLNQGIFTEDEIHTIVSKRRHFEYLLHRNKTRKTDFDNYIKSEEGLERLRSLRYKKMHIRSKEARKKNERSVGNVHIIQNIHSIYNKYSHKYSNDVSIFMKHMSFSRRVGSYRVLQRVIAQALNLHSKNIMLWIEVASQEFFGDEKRSGGNIDNARVLFQRGIRINPHCKDLYGQYFALELHYLMKIRGRNKLKNMLNDNEEHDTTNDNHELATIIYRNATKAIPNDVAFHLHFIQICKLFPHTHNLQSLIMATIQQTFHDSPDAWIARAVFALQNNNALSVDNIDNHESNEHSNDNSCLPILEQAMTQIPTVEMFLKVISFLKDLLLTQEDNKLPDEDILSCFTKTFELIQQSDISSPKLISEHATFILSTGDVAKANDILQNGTKQYPNSTDLWLQHASLAYKIEQSGLETSSDARSILRKGLRTIPIHEQSHVVLLIALLEHLLSLCDKSHSEEIQTLYQTITLLSSPKTLELNDKLTQLSISYYHYCVTLHGSKYAQQIYPSILTFCCTRNSTNVKSLVEACIALEQAIAVSCASVMEDYKKRIDKIFKIASSLEDVDLSYLRQKCDLIL